MEGMEPLGSSRVMRSMRVMGKKRVGTPTRSVSGSLIWRMKGSKELRSMPRTVTPAVLKLRSSPQIFSLGVWRLMTTMEWGSMGERQVYRWELKVEREEKSGERLVVKRIGVCDVESKPAPLKAEGAAPGEPQRLKPRILGCGFGTPEVAPS